MQERIAKNRRGFTLVELIVVTVIIGVISAIAIPQYFKVKGRAHVASMKTDLRNLATAEEMYFAEHSRYTDDLGALAFRPSSGVRIQLALGGTASWSASATHTASTQSCVIYVGAAARVPAAGAEGVPACIEGSSPATSPVTPRP